MGAVQESSTMSSKLLTNGTILAFHSNTSSISVLRNAHLLIIGDTITTISSDLSSIETPNDTETVDCTDKIISPGFVDTHRHVWQAAWRTLGPNTTLTEYLLKNTSYGTAREPYSSDDLYISSLAGYAEALNAGVTTILDHAHNNWRKDIMNAGFKGAVDSGARVWWCYDPTSFASEGWGYDEQVAGLKDLATQTTPLVQMGLSFDGLPMSDATRIENVKSLIRDLNCDVTTTHYLGSPWPSDNSPSFIDSHGLLDLNAVVIFSHGGFIPDADIKLLREKNHYLSITPESEMHYGHGQVASRKCQDHASLGIDTAWTFSGDILTQARIWLQSNRQGRFEKVLSEGKLPKNTPMTAEQAFLLATRQGGLALRKDNIGILKEGAKADVVIFNGDSPGMLGWSDPIAAVVLHANVGDIEGVIVGGEWRKKEGKLVGDFGGSGDWKQVKTKFLATAKKVHDADTGHVADWPEKLWGMADIKEVEDQVTL